MRRKTQSRIAANKTPNLLNIFVTNKHEDLHVEFSTISTGFSFFNSHNKQQNRSKYNYRRSKTG